MFILHLKKMEKKKIVFISSITSDIGCALAKRYIKEGWNVVGTYKSKNNLEEIQSISKYLFFCDFTNKESVKKCIEDYNEKNICWDLFIACAGTQKPIKPFFECDFDEWDSSLHINAIEQLRLLHSTYNSKDKKDPITAVFFGGPGTNNAIKNYSAYCISKIILIKMCELLDFENDNFNIFIIGPGWVKTKMHYETIGENRRIIGENYDKTIEFMENGKGTSMDEIYECVNTLCTKGKVSSGKNFSLVHDTWRDCASPLFDALKKDENMYKLRRFKNEFK